MNELKITEKANFRELIAPEGMVVYNKRTGVYYARRVPVPLTADVADYEAAIKPVYSKEEYDAKVAQLVRERYSADEEFALQRKMIATLLHPEAATLDESGEDTTPAEVREFEAYNAFVEDCKARATDPDLYKPEELPARHDDTSATER